MGEGFEEVEALCAADVLRRGGVEVTTTGLDRRTVVGSHGIPVTADAVAADVELAAGDMVVLPGGLGGVAAIEGSETAMALVRQAAEDGEIWLCAICAAPNMLARHALIGKGRRAVCYPGMEGALTEAGVTACMDEPVVVDGMLITGRAPGASFDFALALLTALRSASSGCAVRRRHCPSWTSRRWWPPFWPCPRWRRRTR